MTSTRQRQTTALSHLLRHATIFTTAVVMHQQGKISVETLRENFELLKLARGHFQATCGHLNKPTIKMPSKATRADRTAVVGRSAPDATDETSASEDAVAASVARFAGRTS